MKKIIITLLALGTLAACNSGTSSSSDVQTGSVTLTNNLGNQFTVNLTATGCKGISTNGTCSVTMTYTGTGNFSGPLTSNNINGYNIPVSACNNASMLQNSCNFTITNTGGSTSSAQQVTIYANAQTQYGASLFVVGGGI